GSLRLVSFGVRLSPRTWGTRLSAVAARLARRTAYAEVVASPAASPPALSPGRSLGLGCQGSEIRRRSIRAAPVSMGAAAVIFDKRRTPEPVSGRPAPEGLYLHAAFVRRRAVEAGDRDVVEPQVDGELAAVMDDVVHHEAAMHGDLGHGEDHVLAVAEGPGLVPGLVAGAGEGRPGRGDVLVEERQELLGGLRLGGVVAAGEVELVGGDGRGGPARELGEVDGEAAEGHGLRVRLPGGLVHGHALEGAPGVGHLHVELGKQGIADAHGKSPLEAGFRILEKASCRTGFAIL